MSDWNGIDRGLISVALTNIESEFNFTGTELGLQSGLAFAVVYPALSVAKHW